MGGPSPVDRLLGDASGMSVEKIIYIVSPSGAVGGGMGRVKDYILQGGAAAEGRYRFEVLVTRDENGAAYSLILLLLAILKIWRARLTGKLALVHVHFGDKGSALRKGLVILGARMVGAPTLLHLHAAELTGFYADSNALVRFLLRLPFRCASSIIVLGRLWRDWLINDLNIEGGKIDVLYNGVPVETTPRDFLSTPDRRKRILFLGLLTERKGISDLLNALALLPAGTPDWEAIIAGNGDIPLYKQKARELGIDARVDFKGWVGQGEVRALLGAVDGMVLPSYNEGLPLVILEALGAGTPVICTPIGAIPEVLEHNRSVLFVEPGNRTELSSTLAGLLSDPGLCQRLSNEGQAMFRQRFTLGVFLDGLFSIYRARFGIDVAPKPAGAKLGSVA